MEKMKRAVRAEVWGELYAREHLGIHQIHSRRASCARAASLGRTAVSTRVGAPMSTAASLFRMSPGSEMKTTPFSIIMALRACMH